jgi:hypothetical protein
MNQGFARRPCLDSAEDMVVAVRDLSGSDWESISLASNPKFMALIEESRRSYRDSGGINLEDLRHELDLGTATRPRSSQGRKKVT